MNIAEDLVKNAAGKAEETFGHHKCHVCGKHRCMKHALKHPRHHLNKL